MCAKRIKISLAERCPELISEWDYDKNNGLSPHGVSFGSNKKVWWKCKKGHEWQATVSHRSQGGKCPICFGESKTSFPEQAIYYLRKVTVAINRYKLDSRTEIDIYLPDLRIGIEYDGSYYHKGKTAEERERRKQQKLDDIGIRLIRVRELAGGTSDHTIYVKAGANDAELSCMLNELLSLINEVAGVNYSVNVDIERDRVAIYNLYLNALKENSLANGYPKIAEEWSYDKNGALTPEYIDAHSNKKVWWKCQNGHEWQAIVNSRVKGAGCPYCAGYKPIVGENDLMTVNPRLASQWHPVKNGNLTPQHVLAFSNKFVWWVCDKGHEWRAMIYDRSNGCGCPICSGRVVLPGFNDLATKNPDLAGQWHPTKNGTKKPSDVIPGSHEKAWWKCEKGHEWEASIGSRNSGCGCPYCAGQKLLVGENDLATVNPQLAKEWHPNRNGKMTPYNTNAGAHKKVWWLGMCGHEWEAAVYSRVTGKGCPYCSGRLLLQGFNDLATRNPELASEWHPTKNGDMTPESVMAGSNKKVWWLCKNGHEWNISPNTRKRGNGCPYCSNQKLLRGYNDLQTLNPELATEWHPTKNGSLTPSDFIPGSNKKAWWKCENGHEWEAVIKSRTNGAGCKECYRMRRRKNKP